MKQNCATPNTTRNSTSRSSTPWQHCCRGGVPVLLALAMLLPSAPAARGGSLADVFSSGQLAGLEMEPIGPALANTVATTYPVASASSSVTYVYNPALESFERRTQVLGPIIGERAETIGKGQLNIGFSLSWVDISTVNGDDMGDLVNKASVGGRVVSFPVPGGVTLADGRFSNFLPVLVHANIDVEANIGTPSITYGVTPDLDLNLSLPIMTTYLGVKITEDVPDPRLPEFALNPGDPNEQQLARSDSARATGFGDLLLRGKYVVHRGEPFDVAALLGVSFPSGNQDDFHGTGTYRLQPSLIMSRVIAERFEPLLNLGVDINADNVDRSAFRWAIGGTGKVVGPLTAAAVFLGRNEFNAQSDPIAAPFFFQIERNDVYDFSFGLRLLFAESGVVSANAIVPLNRDGLRADIIPTLQVEYAFSAPW